jgi:uncharacterized protein (DUF2236 family)
VVDAGSDLRDAEEAGVPAGVDGHLSTEAHETYRRMVLWDFAWECRTGLNLAFYRTFAIPRIAELLGRTGEIAHQPLKRSMDTGLLMYEMIEGGPASERGRTVIRMLNRMHRRWSISDEDYRYVLTTFIVVPTRWIDEMGWRKTTPAERAATTEFYAEVGRLMGIRDVPTSYDEAAMILDEYEAANLGYSEAGAALMKVTSTALEGLFPRPARGLSDLLTSLLLSDEMCDALGVQPPSRWERKGFAAAMRVRAALVPHWPDRKQPAFRVGKSGSHVYPEGYELSELGVQPEGVASPKQPG